MPARFPWSGLSAARLLKGFKLAVQSGSGLLTSRLIRLISPATWMDVVDARQPVWSYRPCSKPRPGRDTRR